MGTLRLHPKDCERFSVPEVIDFDLTAIGVRQRKAFETATKKPLGWLFDQMQGVPELDEAGNPIPDPVFDEAGEPVIDETTGEQKVEPRLTTDPDAIVMFVWLVLWGHGVRVPWDDFDVREIGLRLNFADGSGESGKADEPPAESSNPTTD